MRALRRLEDALYLAERVLVCVLLALLVLVAFLQVVLRQFSIGFIWADSLLHQLVLAAGFLGATVAAHDQHHFAVDAVARLFPPAVFLALTRLGRALGAAASFALGCASWQFVAGEFQSVSRPFTVYFELVLPVAFFLMAFHFAMRIPDPPREAGEH